MVVEMFSICQVTSKDRVAEVSLGVMDESIVDLKHCGGGYGYMMFLICHVIQQNHTTKELCYFIDWRPSRALILNMTI